jgi:hypothetical protein
MKPLGDLVAEFAKMMGIKKPCAPCERRRKKLNALHARAAAAMGGKRPR